MGQIGRKMGEIWPKSWRFWRIFEAQMAKSPKTNLGTLVRDGQWPPLNQLVDVGSDEFGPKKVTNSHENGLWHRSILLTIFKRPYDKEEASVWTQS